MHIDSNRMNNENQNTNNTNNTKNKEQEIGALWTKKSKAGASFLSGYILNEQKQRVNVVVFKNSYKKPGEKTPDFRLYLSEVKQDATASGVTQDNFETNQADNGRDDEIPF